MKDFIFLSQQINQGQSVLRAFLNLRLKNETLRGKIIDIGSGTNPAYIGFMKRSHGAELKTFDVKIGTTTNFEKDLLPAPDSHYDTVIFLNVMEHIFNHQHIACEVVRILKPGGQLIGFVPFLMWYHPDPNDFFRYTHQALQIIFDRAGAKNIIIEPVAFGPGVAAAHMVLQSFPRVLRLPLFCFFYCFDLIYRIFRLNRVSVFALGYVFFLSK
jgi:SAM-dependent methyltransferase